MIVLRVIDKGMFVVERCECDAKRKGQRKNEREVRRKPLIQQTDGCRLAQQQNNRTGCSMAAVLFSVSKKKTYEEPIGLERESERSKQTRGWRTEGSC